MNNPRGFTLLEVLLAAALLALVAAACLPLVRGIPTPAEPALADTHTTTNDIDTLRIVQRSDADIGEHIRGQWLVVDSPEGIQVVWRRTTEGTP